MFALRIRFLIRLFAAVMLMAASAAVRADLTVEYHASLAGQVSSGSLAPYMLGSWNEGRYVAGSGVWQEAGISRALEADRRFSWSAGIGYIAGYGEKTDYSRWDSDAKTWGHHAAGMPAFRFTRLFCQLKYRQAFLTVGIAESPSLIVDAALSSGDLTRSSNAAPVPGAAIGFLDFQNVPFTKGWLQIEGQIMYGKMTDSGFRKAAFNNYSGDIATNLWYHYKRLYFRTNPDKNFHVVAGMQAAGLFAGQNVVWSKGRVIITDRRGFRLKDMFQMFFPQEGGEDYYTGSHLGSWDLKATYRFRDGSALKAYFEWPWEDGSGIGRQNGWDGLWGIQYDFARKGILSKVVVEYLDFTNQAGPIHYAPHDHPGSVITGQAQGSDDYYNNDYYGPYANYGMGMGSPFLLAPVYNRSGVLAYLHNRARGFHVALEGNPSDRWSWRAKVSWQKAGGSGWVPAPRFSYSTSAQLEASVEPFPKVPQLCMRLAVAFDKGDLRGDNFGARLQVAYTGDFTFKKSRR